MTTNPPLIVHDLPCAVRGCEEESERLYTASFDATYYSGDVVPGAPHIVLCDEHITEYTSDGGRSVDAVVNPNYPQKLLLLGARYNLGDLGVAIFASVLPSVDWTAYIGLHPWSVDVTTWEQVMFAAFGKATKLSHDDARYYFPHLDRALPWRH